MAIRICPKCMAKVSPGSVVAYSDSIECPGCKQRLEVSTPSRMLATALGLLAAALVWRLTRYAGGMLGWALPTLYAFLAFAVVSPLYLMLSADLRLAPSQASAEAVSASASPDHGAPRH